MISKLAAEQLYKVIKEYVPPPRVPSMLRDLGMVEGNRSYRDTIAEVMRLHGVEEANR